MTARRVLLAWLLASAAGSLLIALPDTGPPVIRISRTHGPGPLDLVGIGLVLFGVVLLLWWLISRRRAIASRLGRSGVIALAAALMLSLAEVAWSVLADNGPWWVIGAGTATVVQLVALAASGERFSAQSS